MIVSGARYRALHAGEPLICYWSGKLKTVKPATSKSGFTNSGFSVRNEKTGELQERETFRGRGGCPAEVGTLRKFTTKAEIGQNMPASIHAVVTDAVFCETPSGDWKWRVTFMKNSRQRPARDDSAGIYLAPTTGYGPRSSSIDQEASAFDSEHVQKFIADDRAAKAEARRKKIAAVRDATEAMLGDEELERWAHRIRQELDKAEKAA